LDFQPFEAGPTRTPGYTPTSAPPFPPPNTPFDRRSNSVSSTHRTRRDVSPHRGSIFDFEAKEVNQKELEREEYYADQENWAEEKYYDEEWPSTDVRNSMEENWPEDEVPGSTGTSSYGSPTGTITKGD